MLFDKKIEPCCAYCRHGVKLCPTDVACLKCGVVSSGGACRKFTYDPLKRVPPAHVLIKTSQYTEADFAL